MTNFNSDIITYSYDAMNRLTTKQLGVNNAVNYTYTPTSSISSVTDARGTTRYNYDLRDLLVEQIEADGQFLRYSYDKSGNRTGITTQAGTTTYAYDRYHQLTDVTDVDGKVTNYIYDKAGNVKQIKFADGTIETRSYDLLNHLVQQETSNAAGALAVYTYTLDAAGKQVQSLENNGRKVNYVYDGIARLLSEQITDAVNGNRNTSYVFDGIGNRLIKNDSVMGLTTYIYDAGDRLIAETNGNSVTTYVYDNNGNTLSKTNANDQTINSWDVENRLIQASVTINGVTNTTQYQHDSNGARVESITNGNTTKYLVDANRPHAQVVMEYDSINTIFAEYVYGLGLIEQERSGVKFFYHADRLGSTRFLTNESGSITDTYLYDAYGNIINSSGQTANNYLYTGEQFDANSREYYLRARYYNPSIGRFTGRDPFEGFLTEPLSLAKYSYVHNNPINMKDPTGLFALTLEGSLTASLLSTLTAITPVLSNVAVGASIIGVGASAALQTDQIKLVLSYGLLKAYNLAGERNGRLFIPVVYYGDRAGFYQNGKGLKNLEKTTLHVYESIVFDWRTPLLSAGKTPGHGPRSWYNITSECNSAQRKLAMGTLNINEPMPDRFSVVCDEYPFYSSEQGGQANYNMRKVSLKFVPGWEAIPQGNLMSSANLKWADVVEGDPWKKWYGVIAIPGMPFSGWSNRDGGFKFQ
jgi:RHS repeat-associated protein